ncbi:MAG: DNA-processing protein DprA [Deltaproteobacteria bacterium]|nr:DNA-processing protein DprA [Deltaproteobacteria bacterium]
MSLWSNKKCYWIALSGVKGIGNVTFKNLLSKFGDPERIIRASKSELSDVNGLRKETVQDIVNQRFEIDPEAEIKKAGACGARIVTFHDPEYPAPLKEIHDPPMILYMKGACIPQSKSFIAIVGSRNATHYGLKVAEEFGQGLARRGLGIVSGMALGIDAWSHWGCIAGKGFTVAVLGNGIDIVYPLANRKLYDKVCESGTIVSEFPMGTSPSPPNFPQRNRIISGLSKGVLVVEATKNSGSLITASIALDQGKDVFAVPGSIESYKSRGCHFLIKHGAMLVENADDIMESLGMNYPGIPKGDTMIKRILPEMNDIEKTIFDIIGDYPMHIDEIQKQGNIVSGELSGTLTKLELKGIIKQLPGKMFVK